LLNSGRKIVIIKRSEKEIDVCLMELFLYSSPERSRVGCSR